MTNLEPITNAHDAVAVLSDQYIKACRERDNATKRGIQLIFLLTELLSGEDPTAEKRALDMIWTLKRSDITKVMIEDVVEINEEPS